MKDFVFFLAIGILSLSCSKSTQTNYDVPVFNLSNNTEAENAERITYSRFYKNLDGFQLDTTGGLVGWVSKMDIFDNKIFILDTRFAEKLFVFDLQTGKKLFTIGTRGKGPGESLLISDFTIDEKQKMLLTCDVFLRRLCYYDLNGKLIEEKQLPFSPKYISLFDEKLIFLCNHNVDNYKLIVTDDKINILAGFFSKTDYPVDYVACNNPFFKYNNKLLINFGYCDTVYTIDNNLKLNPYSIFNTGEFSFYKRIKSGVELPQKILLPPKNLALFGNSITPIENYFENDHYLNVIFRQNNKPRVFLFNKNTKKEHIIKGVVLVNDIVSAHGTTIFKPGIGTVMCCPSDYFTSPKRKLPDSSIATYSERFKKEYLNLNPEGNPFVFIFN